MRNLLLLVALGWSSEVALAQGQPAPALEGLLSVQRDPAGCIEEPALRARVARWLEPRALVPTRGLRVVVSVDPVAFGLQRDGRDIARRRFEALPALCASRLDALALAIALSLENLARTEPSEFAASDPQPVATPVPAAAPVPAVAPVPPAAERAAAVESGEREAGASSATHASFALLAHGSLWFEALPESAAALGLGLELSIGRLRFAAIALGSTETDSAIGGGRALSRFFGARVHGCLTMVVIAPDLHAEPCAGVVAGVVLARGNGFPVEKNAALAYVAPLVRLALRYPARGPLSVRIAVDGLLNALRPELRVRGPSTASDSTAQFGAAPSLELLLELP